MLTFMYVEMNIFALVVLLLIFLNVSHRSAKQQVEQKLFLTLLGSNAVILVLDGAMWVLDGRQGPFIIPFYMWVTALYYALNPIICMIWTFYADFHIHRDEKRLKKYLVPALLPVVINTVLSLLSIWNGYMFTIDEAGIYHRGALFPLMAFISYMYLMYSLIHILMNQKRIQKQYFFSILAFAFPPFLGGIVQILVYGVSLIWVSMTLSVLIVFINIQNDQLHTDHLTGLYNRRQLDNYLQRRIRKKNGKQQLAGIMIDMDSFKLINDRFGHHVGDQALENTADILQRTFLNSSFIARFGGDEFVVILDITNPQELTEAVEALIRNVEIFNAWNADSYSISLSIGFDILESRTISSSQDFINHLDALMYQNKILRSRTPEEQFELQISLETDQAL